MRHLLSKLLCCASLAIGAISPLSAHADTLVSTSMLKSTENGLFMSNGRYFVAGQDGIHEIKRTPDPSPNCRLDTGSGYTVCEVLPTRYGTDTCFYSGMTTDHTYLYAACTVWRSDSVLSQLVAPKRSLLVRIRPGTGSVPAEVKYRPFAQNAWYNGMAMLDANTLLMSPSSPLGTKPAIVKLRIRSSTTLDHSISDWLPGSPLYLLNNGIAVDNGHVYFVGGQNLWRIFVKSDGSPALPVLLYQAPVNKALDDIVVNGDWIAVAEVGIVNGLGVNTITFVHKTGLGVPAKVWTGLTQLSSLAVDPGSFGTPGAYIGTSYFQGGIHRYFY